MNIKEYVRNIKEKKTSAFAAVEPYVKSAKADKFNAVLEVFDDWKEQAKRIDEKIACGEKTGELAGVPIVIKDNILYKSHHASAASKILENFIAPYNATVVERLVAADAVIIARSNMDEFGFGSTGGNSAFGGTKNPLNEKFVAGGSSSGSAAAVAAGYCLAALATDTGGSARMPASFCGIVGLKPSYGSVSRFGMIAYGSGVEQVGVMTKNVEDCALVYKIISGPDEKDLTTRQRSSTPVSKTDLKNLKIARVKEIWDGAKSI